VKTRDGLQTILKSADQSLNATSQANHFLYYILAAVVYALCEIADALFEIAKDLRFMRVNQEEEMDRK